MLTEEETVQYSLSQTLEIHIDTEKDGTPTTEPTNKKLCLLTARSLVRKLEYIVSIIDVLFHSLIADILFNPSLKDPVSFYIGGDVPSYDKVA